MERREVSPLILLFMDKQTNEYISYSHDALEDDKQLGVIRHIDSSLALN